MTWSEKREVEMVWTRGDGERNKSKKVEGKREVDGDLIWLGGFQERTRLSEFF